jgi:hypothetical protein
MNDPLEDRLRTTLRQAAQQTTTTHDIGLPPPSARPARSRRLAVTAALTALALVGVGALVASRDDGPQTVQAAAGDEADTPGTTVGPANPMMALFCSNAPQMTLPPRLADKQAEIQSAIGDFCANGGANGLAGTAYAACAIDPGSIRDLLGPLLADLGPQIEQLKAIAEEFEPRIRAITDDPATKARIEAQLAPLRERLEGLADPANRPDLSDPAARQKLFDELKADLEPLANDTELRPKFDAIADDLRERLEELAATPEVQALKDRLQGFAQSGEAKALADKLADCVPR